MKKEQKKLHAPCRFCNKRVYSYYENQLKHNLKVHEDWCPERKEEKK